MILLYRLLFLLYAEGKGLLDLRNENYRDSHSFDKIKKEVSVKKDGPIEHYYLPTSTSLWGSLKGLFRLIDKGSQELKIDHIIHIPAYNGGLFEPEEENRQLDKWTIGDSFLADAIDLLSRSGVGEGGMGFVDYSTLEIRHLGSIYEGLLEYKLMVAESDLVVIGSEKERRWITLEDYNKEKSKKKAFGEFDEFDRARIGELYLSTDNGERKATGSYYTPDYIVNYIVANTIDPVVEERWKLAEENKSSNVDATLSVKVLDPAMGSGHFLVGAVEFLAVKLMAAAQHDIETGLVEDDGQFTNDWAKREAVSHCVYGVDLNDMAVELAKVSLWLTTISREKPLSFLDHRLKKGNSLIGARISDLKNYPGGKRKDENQTSLPSFVSPLFIKNLIGKIKELEGIEEDTLSDIKRKEKVFEEFKALPQYTKAKAIANVHTSLYFGNQIEPTRNKDAEMVYHDMFWGVAGDEAEWRRKTWGQWFKQAQEIADQKAFFHWELEFPEIFFEGGNVKDDPGFDAVVGNPPYFLVQGSCLQTPLSMIYPEIFSGSNDISHFFFVKGAQLLQKKRLLGVIVTRYWMEAHFTGGLRNFLTTIVQPVQIIDFGNLQVWPEVNVLALICVFRKSSVDKTQIYLADEILYSNAKEFFDEAVLLQKGEKIEIQTKLLNDLPWYLRSIASVLIWEKMNRLSVPLDDITTNTQGIKTGNNKVFTVSPSTIQEMGLEGEALVHVAEAQDLERYAINSNNFVIYTDGSFDIEAVPAINSYLSQFKTELSKRAECNKGHYPWWRLQRPRDRNTMLNGERILVPLYSTKNRFYCSKEAIVGMTGIYIISPTNDHYNAAYLSAILNSQLLNKYHSIFCKVKRAGYLEYSGEKISKLPIRRVSFTTPEPERARLVTELKQLYQASKFDDILSSVESCLPKDAQNNFISEQEKSDVVHDLLAFLAEQMLEMNKQKQQEIKGFLSWLEREVGAKVEDLSPKTKVQEYYKLPFDELLAILKKNKRKIAIDPARREPQERLRAELAASVGKLKPLMERIAATDELIDQIVYRLYGLTEEEIKIVKGNVN